MPKAVSSTSGPTAAAKRKATTAARSATVRGEQPEPEDVLTGVPVTPPRRRRAAPPVDEIDDGFYDGDDDEPGEEMATGPTSEYYRPDRDGLVVGDGLSFTSAPKPAEGLHPDDVKPFDIDGEIYVATRPSDDAYVLMATAGATTTPFPDRVAAIIEFLYELVDEQDFLRIRVRLKDRKDPLTHIGLFEHMTRVTDTFPNRGPKQSRARARPPRR